MELDTKYLFIVAMNVVNNMSKQTYHLSLSVLSMMLQLRKRFLQTVSDNLTIQENMANSIFRFAANRLDTNENVAAK